MPHAGLYILASLISGVSTALILASGSSYTELRSPQGPAEDVKQGPSRYDGPRCRGGSCQVAYLNSVEDFCLWAPSQPTTEHTLVAWCMNDARQTRLMPEGTITGAHLLITPDYLQITGTGFLSKINVPADGAASVSGHGQGDVITNAYGSREQIRDWTSFVSQDGFCFRACKPSAAASGACPQIRDISNCLESVPGHYDAGTFKDCIDGTRKIPSAAHDSAHPFSRCTIRSARGGAEAAHAKRAVAPLLIPSPSHSYFRPHHRVLPTTADTAMTYISPTITPTSMSTSTTASSDDPVSTPYSFNHTHTHSSFSHHTFSHSPSSSSTASSSNDPSTPFAPSSPAPMTPYFTFTFPSPSSDPPFSASSVTSASVPTSMLSPVPSPSFSSPYGTSPSSPSSSYDPPTSTSSSVLPFTPFSTPSTTSSPSSYTQTSNLTSVSRSPAQPTLPASSSPSTSSSASASPPASASTSSTSSQSSSRMATFTSPSAPSMPPTSTFRMVPNSQTQIGSQCPLYPRVINAAGSIVSMTPLLLLTLPILMIVLVPSIV